MRTVRALCGRIAYPTSSLKETRAPVSAISLDNRRCGGLALRTVGTKSPWLLSAEFCGAESPACH